MKLHLISAKNGEFVAFTNGGDANWTATGKHSPFGLPTLGVAFREAYDDITTFPMITIELTDEQAKELKVPLKHQTG